jgi:hypothetical protein
MHAAEMAAIGEAEDAPVQFEGYVNVHAVLELVGAKQHFSCVAVEGKEKVFAFAFDRADPLPFGKARELRGFLWLRSDGMQDVDAANPATLDERTYSARDGFHFGEFRHQSD